MAITQNSPKPANTVIRNGAVYTVDVERSWAEAIAIRDGKIVYVGTNQGVERYIGPDTTVVELNGEMVLPGFHDSHLHPLQGGQTFDRLDLSGLKTKEEMVEAVRLYAEHHPEKDWLLGFGFSLNAFSGDTPRKEELDAVISERPVYLVEAEAHTAWLNSKALELAKIDKDTVPPEGGIIERDPVTREPSGALQEPFFFDVETIATAKRTLDDEYDSLSAAVAKANSLGITSMMDAIVDEKTLAVYECAQQSGGLNARFNLALLIEPGTTTTDLDKLVKKFREDDRFRVRINTAKLLLDGILTAKTGLLLEPYEGDSDNCGPVAFPQERLNSIFEQFTRQGFHMHLHAVGDGAVRMALDAAEYGRQFDEIEWKRHQITHIDVIDPDDIPRFKQLDVIANLQLYWGHRSPYVEGSEPLLGPTRSRWIYPFASLVKAGARIAGSSDWPVSSLNPLEAMQAAMTRQKPGDEKKTPFIPAEKLDLATVIGAYTIDNAYAMAQEHVTGSIEVGKFADLIVLNKNLFEIPAHEIYQTKVLMTMLEGKIVFCVEDSINERTKNHDNH